jgi:hypothetical protein
MQTTGKSLALRFPLRLERAQLVKEESREAYAKLIAQMAQTPRGSWRPCPGFGFREKLEELQSIVAKDMETEEQRTKRCEALAAEVNAALLELGLEGYCVDRLELHLPPRDIQGRARAQWASHLFDDISALFVLRPNSEFTPGIERP